MAKLVVTVNIWLVVLAPKRLAWQKDTQSPNLCHHSSAMYVKYHGTRKALLTALETRANAAVAMHSARSAQLNQRLQSSLDSSPVCPSSTSSIVIRETSAVMVDFKNSPPLSYLTKAWLPHMIIPTRGSRVNVYLTHLMSSPNSKILYSSLMGLLIYNSRMRLWKRHSRFNQWMSVLLLGAISSSMMAKDYTLVETAPPIWTTRCWLLVMVFGQVLSIYLWWIRGVKTGHLKALALSSLSKRGSESVKFMLTILCLSSQTELFILK